MSKTYELQVKRTIPASPTVVFDAWLDPQALAQFMTPGHEMTVPKAEVDGRVGGKFLIVMKAGDKEMPHHGVYEEVSRPERLVFTWHSPFAGSASRVTLTFRAQGPDETELTLRHVGLESEESRDNHAGGWTAILEALSRTATTAA